VHDNSQRLPGFNSKQSAGGEVAGYRSRRVIICEGCGTTNEEGASYCSKCARKLDVETQQAVAARRAEHSVTAVRLRAVLIAGVITLIVLVVIVLVVTRVI